MELKNISDDLLYQEFISAKKRKEVTKWNHLYRMLMYCRFHEMTPTQLIEEAEDDQINQPIMRKRNLPNRLISFRNHMEQGGKTKSTIETVMGTVVTFYRYYSIERPEISYSVGLVPQRRSSMNDLPTLDHLEQIVEKANPKLKAMITLAMSSGMGSGEVRSLKISDFLDAHGVYSLDEIDISNIPTWHIKRIKMNMPYYTFSSPESNKYIIKYLKTRENPLPNEYLFQSKIKGQTGHCVLGASCRRLNDRCGFGAIGKQRFFHFHVLRKFFMSTCVNNGMEILDADWLLGHKIPNIQSIYTKPSIHRLKNEYMKILPHVSITPIKPIVMESDEVIEIRKELKLQREKLALFEAMTKEQQD